MVLPTAALTLSTPALLDHTRIIVSIQQVFHGELEREISPSDQSIFALEDVLNWVPWEWNQKAKYLSHCQNPQTIGEESSIFQGGLLEIVHRSTK